MGPALSVGNSPVVHWWAIEVKSVGSALWKPMTYDQRSTENGFRDGNEPTRLAWKWTPWQKLHPHRLATCMFSRVATALWLWRSYRNKGQHQANSHALTRKLCVAQIHTYILILLTTSNVAVYIHLKWMSLGVGSLQVLCSHGAPNTWWLLYPFYSVLRGCLLRWLWESLHCVSGQETA